MLLNLEIKVIATNNGKDNEVSVSGDISLSIMELLTTLHMAKQNYLEMLKVYVNSNFKKEPTEKQLQKITLKDIYQFAQVQSDKGIIIDNS